MHISPITLGTVQLGMSYGIANRTGLLSENDSIQIIKYAWENGINAFDTAPAYGESEKRIGIFIKTLGLAKKDNSDPIIVTKISGLQNKKMNFEESFHIIHNSIQNSLNNLNLNQIPICLLHNANDLGNDAIQKSLIRLKDEGLVKKIGVSVYTPHDVELFLDSNSFDAIQIPINIFDQRLIKSGLLKELNKKSKIIFARSVFLQGLFFLDPNLLPNNLQIAKPFLIKLEELRSQTNLSKNQFALAYVKAIPELTSILIGVDTLNQLKLNIEDYKNSHLDANIINDIKSEFLEIPEKIIDPSKWNQ